jgi:hypothetical protein
MNLQWFHKEVNVIADRITGQRERKTPLFLPPLLCCMTSKWPAGGGWIEPWCPRGPGERCFSRDCEWNPLSRWWVRCTVTGLQGCL